jgi:hypothetical protein
MKIVLTTGQGSIVQFITSPVKRNTVSFVTSKGVISSFITSSVARNLRTFLTANSRLAQFITEQGDPLDFECCKYPSWLEEYRKEAVLLFYPIILEKLNVSYNKELHGKISKDGYILSTEFKALIEYLSIISLHMREDENAAFIRTPEYYEELYNLDCIKTTFKCKGININPLLTIFKIDTYTSSNYNYDYMDWSYNVEITNNNVTVTQNFRDYFTNYVLTPTAQEDVSPLTGGQTVFTTNKSIKQLLSFIINGNDRIDKVTFTGNTITYVPTGGTFPYTIQSTDTVIANYIYEL